MRDEVNIQKVKLELYIINNEQYTDYDIGDLLYNSNPENEVVEDDAYEVCKEIAKDLYKSIVGEYKCIVEIKLEYTYSYYYFEGWEEDMTYSYQLVGKEETDYWKEN